MRILFVCMGNICRSPTAEAVMRALLRAEGLEQAVAIDSAGTGGWHAGDPPDARAVAAARSRDLVVEGEARRVTAEDFEDFDLLLAMDRDNERELLARAPDDEARAKVRLLREFDPAAAAAGDLDVPDPYYGGPNGFEHVVEAVGPAVVGVGHVEVAGGDRRGIELAQQPDLGARLGVGRACQQLALVFAVHGQHEVEALEVLRGHLARGPLDDDVARPGGGHRARVGRVARVPAAGAGAVDRDGPLEALRAQQPAHDRLGGRRATDVAHADEEDPHGRQDARSGRRGGAAHVSGCTPKARQT